MDVASIIGGIIAIAGFVLTVRKSYITIDDSLVRAVTRGHDKVTVLAYTARISLLAIHLREFVKQDLLDGKLQMMDALDAFLIANTKTNQIRP